MNLKVWFITTVQRGKSSRDVVLSFYIILHKKTIESSNSNVFVRCYLVSEMKAIMPPK